MTAFAGIVSDGRAPIESGRANYMLSHIVAPKHGRKQHFGDSHIDLAVQHRAVDAEYYADARVCVVVCGRIDSPQGLCDRLSISKSEFNSARVFAAAYGKWGDELLRNIAGEFTFVIWDREERSLFCGRDRFGQMPFAYLESQGTLLFGSDFLSVAMGHNPPPIIDEAWIVGYVNKTILDDEGTPFQGVKRLPPASTLKWRNGCISLQKYWSFEEIGPSFERFSLSDLTAKLERSIQSRTMGTKSATMLSGGLDSSSVAVLARDLRRKNGEPELPSVSLVFDDFPEQSERPFIESVVSQGGFNPHFVNVQQYDAVSEIDRLVRIQGGPTTAIGTPIFDQALERVEQLGFTSVLDGHGGDEVISSHGVMRLFELANNAQWLTLIRETSRLSRRSELDLISSIASLYGSKGRSVFASLVRKIHWRLKALKPKPSTPKLLKPELESHPSVFLAERLAKNWLGSSHNDERQFQESVLSAPLQAHAFEHLHRLFRSRGIRPEFPFWDSEVVSFCVRVPSSHKLKGGIPRSLIRSVMGDRLPKNVANRTSKFDFTDAHVRSFRTSSDRMLDLAANHSHTVFDYIDRDAFVAAITDLSSERRQPRREAHGTVWTSLNLLLWFDMMKQYQSVQKGSVETSC